jgi:hypothetical protein
MKTLLMIGALLLSVSANAQATFCPDPKKLAEEIMNCDQNEKAALYAEACSSELLGQSFYTKNRLARMMTGLQNAAFSTEGGRMARAERELQNMANLIQLSHNSNDLVSRYTEAMIDFPDGVDEHSSAPCFNSAFTGLQQAVSSLDSDIIQSEDAYAEARSAFAAWKEKRADAKQLLAAAALKLKAGGRDTRQLSSQKKKRK